MMLEDLGNAADVLAVILVIVGSLILSTRWIISAVVSTHQDVREAVSSIRRIDTQLTILNGNVRENRERIAVLEAQVRSIIRREDLKDDS